MDATSYFIIGIVGAAILAVAGIFTVAVRRSPSSGPVTGSLDRRAVKKDRQRVAAVSSASGAVATLPAVDEAEGEPEAAVDAPAEPDEAPPEPDEAPPADAPDIEPIVEKIQVTEAEYGVTRRKFFNRAILLLFGAGFLLPLGLGMLAFFWPKLRGGFGSKIVAGSVDELRSAIINSDGTISPLFFPAAQSWIVPIDEAVIPGSSFDGQPVAAGGGGGEPALMAMWQRCVHLGCRVPSCESSQGFECPCHGSKYNFHGEYNDGPAPRNMDRFAVEVNEANQLVIDTGLVVETPRAKVSTIAYPQGPTCL